MRKTVLRSNSDSSMEIGSKCLVSARATRRFVPDPLSLRTLEPVRIKHTLPLNFSISEISLKILGFQKGDGQVPLGAKWSLVALFCRNLWVQTKRDFDYY